MGAGMGRTTPLRVSSIRPVVARGTFWMARGAPRLTATLSALLLLRRAALFQVLQLVNHGKGSECQSHLLGTHAWKAFG